MVDKRYEAVAPEGAESSSLSISYYFLRSLSSKSNDQSVHMRGEVESWIDWRFVFSCPYTHQYVATSPLY